MLAAFVAGVCLVGQGAGTVDGEGNYLWPNGQGRSPLKRKGIWKKTPLAGRGATAGELATMNALLERLSALFQATPEAGTLEGYWMSESRTFDGGEKGLPLPYSTRFFPFALEDILRNGQWVPQWAGETESVAFWFNRLPGAMDRPVIVEDIYLRPRVTGTYQGFPVVEGQDLVLARAGRDPWAAVSVARALRAVQPLYEKDRVTAEARLAGLKKKNDETQAASYEAQMRAALEKNYGGLKATQPARWETRLASMERELRYNRELAAKQANPERDKDGAWYWNPVDAQAEAARRLAGLTAEEGNAPACFTAVKGDGRYAMGGTIGVAGREAGCEPLVTDNPGYFDAKLGRAAAQILVVRSIGRCGVVRDGQFVARVRPQAGKIAHGCARHPYYWEQLDWGKVAELVLR